MLNTDVDELRFSLRHAIGSFLFDDVEMPKLIWVTGDEEDVIVALTPREVRGTCELPVNACHSPVTSRTPYGQARVGIITQELD